MAKPESDSLLGAYHHLFANAQKMLQAAQEERWDELAGLQGERQDCLFQVRQSDQTERLANVDIRKSLIEAILACDEQTKVLIANYQQDLLGTFGTSRKLADAYRSSQQ